jgi:D-tyrosyl-tRNA(Tyr) deacylase
VIGLIQRVTSARVEVDGRVVAEIGRGLLALVGVRRGDDEASTRRLLEKLIGYRVFPDDAGRMNLSLRDIGGGLLLVPQFTLAADTHQGLRAGFSSAAEPAAAQRLFDLLVEAARAAHPRVAAGVFGATMQVSLTNDGPVTFWLETPGAT